MTRDELPLARWRGHPAAATYQIVGVPERCRACAANSTDAAIVDVLSEDGDSLLRHVSDLVGLTPHARALLALPVRP